MTDKQIIIDDQKKTIHRLQDECTEKTNAIIALGEQLKRAEKTMQEIWDRLGETTDNLQAKEQECEELKKARKNSRCAWKSLEGTFCPEAQEQLEAYKMEAEEGKEINAELKAENKRLEDLYDRVLQTLKDIEIITQQGIDFFNETERHADWEKVAIFMKQQLSFILGEIEEG